MFKVNKTHILSALFSIISTVFLTAFCAVILALTLRGNFGTPTSLELNDPYWKDEGPLELSPERGRYALMYSVLEENSFHFSLEVARFAAPDVAFANGEFSSLFAPALSFVIMPGYYIGKMFNLGQVGSYAMISLFAIFNMLLIRSIAIRLGAKTAAATVSALIYLFATPAFAYSVSLYQHQVSTFLILSCIYVLQRWKTWPTLLYVWFACAFSVVLDNPNLFFMAPIGIFALTKLISWEETKEAFKLRIKPLLFLTFAVMAIPVAFFMYINYQSYGNPFQLAGTVDDGNEAIAQLLGQPTDLASQKPPETPAVSQTLKTGYEEDENKSALGFFKTRQIPNGLYIHFLSPDRGMLYYTPIILLGFYGIFLLSKYSVPYHRLFIGIVGVNILLYSMWGDPWGGWAFGSRYLIPSYAILSIGLAFVLTKYKHNLLALLIVAGLTGYSIFVNTVGATTTSRIPPEVQVLSLEESTGVRQRYTFTRGMEMLNDDRSKSFFFESVGYDYMTAWEFAITIMIVTGSLNLLLLIKLFLTDRTFSRPRISFPSRK